MGFTLNPIHHHCGPFNSMSKKRPRNEIDAACWDHDHAYMRYSKRKLNPYLQYNNSDQKLQMDLKDSWNPLAIAYNAYFEMKKGIAPRMAEPISNYTQAKNIIRVKRKSGYMDVKEDDADEDFKTENGIDYRWDDDEFIWIEQMKESFYKLNPIGHVVVERFFDINLVLSPFSRKDKNKV